VPQVAKIFSEPLYNSSFAVAGKGWQFEFVPNVNGSSPNPNQVRSVRDADNVTIRYDQGTGSYHVSMPVTGSGTLYRVGDYNPDLTGSSFVAVPANSIAAATGISATMSVIASDRPNSRYSYVSFVNLYAEAAAAGANQRTLAYGVFGIAQPTRAGEVPTTGSARYSGDLLGHFAGDAGATWLVGTAQFDFDFARATLAGELKVNMECMMGCFYGNVVYTMNDTRFVRGDASFSGNLTTTGAPLAGTFSGVFAGPAAAELMSQFQLPFFHPDYRQWLQAGGVILGKRD
jgi:hypothetical protein